MIRDVGGSYRRALAETVHHYCGWRPDANAIDQLKAEGHWNNDWDASLELLRRHGAALPGRAALVSRFSQFYFGGDEQGDPGQWQGFIGDEPLLVEAGFFAELERAQLSWGFVSGAEPPSARYVLEQRLGLVDPPLIAMGDAPDKPDPSGLLQLAQRLEGAQGPWPLAYLGDTVADVLTVLRAREQQPERRLLAMAVLPPHRQAEGLAGTYAQNLRAAGADVVLQQTTDLNPALLSAQLSP